MRVYPLTRVEKDAKGKRLLCFIEFQDAWADTTKATGKLHVALFRSLGLQSEMAQEAQTWDVDLSDLERNARLFDPATRTYRLALRDLPEWLDEQTPVLVRVSLYSGAAPLSAELRLNR